MQAPLVADMTYRAEARSVVVLNAGLEPRRARPAWTLH